MNGVRSTRSIQTREPSASTSSEQALSALENSKADPDTLLDPAAQILGSEFDRETSKFVGINAVSRLHPRNSFREQWVLRWIIKRLRQATGETQDGKQINFLHNIKTWSLLGILLDSIPSQSCRQILLERKYYIALSTVVLSLAQESLQNSIQSQSRSSSEADDIESGRTVKKRRLSIEKNGVLDHDALQSELSLLHKVLEITEQSANFLLSTTIDASHKTHATHAWYTNISDAAALVGAVLELVNKYESYQPRTSNIKHSNLAHTNVQKWLEVWQAACGTSSNPQVKTAAAFSQYCFGPTLNLLNGAFKASHNLAKEALERQIALHFILPVREHFQKHHSKSWKNGAQKLTWQDIKPMYEYVRTYIGPSMAQMQRLEGQDQGAVILSIASRLTLRSDVVRRRSEGPWYEALLASLCYVINPDLSISEHVRQDPTPGIRKVLQQGPLADRPIPHSLVDAFTAMGVDCSVRFCEFILETMVLDPEFDLDSETLSKVLRLNPRACVSSIRKDDSMYLMTLLDAQIQRSNLHQIQSQRTLLEEIMPIVLDEYGRSRRLEDFVGFWHARLSSLLEKSSTADMFWNHVDVFRCFKQAIRNYVPFALLKELVDKTVDALENIHDINSGFLSSSPSHTTAWVSILTSCVEVQIQQQSVQAVSEEQAAGFCALIYRVLNVDHDFSGQRWRYWRLLHVLAQLHPRISLIDSTDRDALLGSILKDPFSDLTIGSDRSAKFLEMHQCFCVIWTGFENGQPDVASEVQKTIKQLASLINRLHKTDALDHNQTEHTDGQTMTTVADMIAACLARLSQTSYTTANIQDGWNNLLVAVCGLLLHEASHEPPKTLKTAAEAFLDVQLFNTDLNLMDHYIQAMTRVSTAERFLSITAYIHEQAGTGISKSQAQKIINVLLQDLTRNENKLDQGAAAEYLTLLSTILARWPALLEPNNVPPVLYNLPLSKLEPNLMETIKIYNAFSSIAEAQHTQSLRKANDEHAQDSSKQTLKAMSKQVPDGDKGLFATTDNILCQVTLLRLLNVDDNKHKKRLVKVRDSWINAIQNERRQTVSAQPSTLAVWKITKLIELHRKLLHVEGSEDSHNLGIDQELAEFLLQCLQSMDADHAAILAEQITSAISCIYESGAKHNNSSSISEQLTELCVSQPLRVQMLEAYTRLRDPERTEISYPDLFQETMQKLQAGTSLAENTSTATIDLPHTYIDIARAVMKLKDEQISASAQMLTDMQALVSLAKIEALASPVSVVSHLELSNLILTTHPRIINQYSIDALLSSLTFLTSSSCMLPLDTTTSNSPQPHHIYDRILTLLNTILIQHNHRRRLTGRMHLLLPLLQNLLKRLFFPPNLSQLGTNPATQKAKAAYLTSLPHWLYSRKSHTNPTLAPDSARKLSRLLQTLCDPTPSTVRNLTRRHTNPSDGANQTLTDESKTLRRHTGQSMQYLVQTHCQASLDGSLAPEIREKLLPGLYAVIGTMDIEVLRVMNAAMGEAARSVWKDLYDEWRRYGRWDGK